MTCPRKCLPRCCIPGNDSDYGEPRPKAGNPGHPLNAIKLRHCFIASLHVLHIPPLQSLHFVSFRFISLQIVSFHCIVAIIACNDCNDATIWFAQSCARVS